MTRKPKNVAAIILFMIAVWALYGFGIYQRHHPVRSYPVVAIILCFAMVIGFSFLVLYGLIKGKVFMGIAPFPAEWIYRAKDPILYWFYMALYSTAAGISIYGFILLSYQFSNGLPIRL